MTNQLHSRIAAALWTDFEPEKNYPAVRPLLAHYTSVATLEKILETNEVWFSNPLYMNDLEELRFGLNEGANRFRSHKGLAEACGSTENHAVLVEFLDTMFAQFERDHALDTYVLCFSEHTPEDSDGILSMWRGYGANGSGVAVVFDTKLLMASEGSPFILGRVRYASGESRRQWIDDKLDVLAVLIAETDKGREELQLCAHVWFERLKLFSLFTKHDGFREENEWRAVYFSDKDREHRLSGMLGYAITSRGVEPKLRVKVTALPAEYNNNLSLDTLIDRIILGPSISSALAARSVERMLTLSGRASLAEKVVASTVPFRP